VIISEIDCVYLVAGNIHINNYNADILSLELIRYGNMMKGIIIHNVIDVM
jgi:hypothetical protein